MIKTCWSEVSWSAVELICKVVKLSFVKSSINPSLKGCGGLPRMAINRWANAFSCSRISHFLSHWSMCLASNLRVPPEGKTAHYAWPSTLPSDVWSCCCCCSNLHLIMLADSQRFIWIQNPHVLSAQTNKPLTSSCSGEAYTGRLMMSTENWDVAQSHFTFS